MAINDVMRNLDEFQQRVDRVIDVEMQLAGTKFQNDARTSGNYKDDTGNLRASVGYGILTPEGRNIFVGHPDGRTVIEEALDRGHGNVLSLVAGMPYARAVEARGYEVISNSVTKARSDFDRRLKNSLKKAVK